MLYGKNYSWHIKSWFQFELAGQEKKHKVATRALCNNQTYQHEWALDVKLREQSPEKNHFIEIISEQSPISEVFNLHYCTSITDKIPGNQVANRKPLKRTFLQINIFQNPIISLKTPPVKVGN